MSTIEFLNFQFLADWPYRVCLPYDTDLLQLARWMSTVGEGQASSRFDIVVGNSSHAWPGSDAIDLFNDIRTYCTGNIVSYSHVVCRQTGSTLFFDMHERFSFFAADLTLLQKLYPFSREIMRENYMLLQEEDEHIKLTEVFQIVQSI